MPLTATSASSSEAHFDVLFAPNGALTGKLAKKHGENHQNSGGICRKMGVVQTRVTGLDRV
jgi:uncharacterized membrane protein